MMNASILLLEPAMQRSKRIHHVLESLGHHVLTVPHAGIALGVLRHVQFDILIVPMAVSAISAQELSAQARMLQPRLRVLIADESELDDGSLRALADADRGKAVSDPALKDMVRTLLARADNAAHAPRAKRPADQGP
jgi:CheY-like chemotaxis protein